MARLSDAIRRTFELGDISATTHSVGGLTENDFEPAARISRLA